MAKKKTPLTRKIRRGRGHSYELDGEKCPGVTTILGEGLPKPFLVGWAARTVAEYTTNRLVYRDGHVIADDLVEDLKAFNDTRRYPEKLTGDFPRLGLTKLLGQVQYADRDEAANRGTEVHRLAEQLAAGEEVEVPEPLVGHVDAYLRFLEEWQPSDALLEVTVVNRRYRYMGTLDMVATIPGLGRCLLDIKTSKAVYTDSALQLAGYRFAETIVDDDGTETDMDDIDFVGVIHVRADGYDLVPMRAGAEEFRIFLYCNEVARWRDDDNPDGEATVRGDALTPPQS